MELNKIILYGILALIGIFMLTMYFKTKKPVVSFIATGFSGLLALVSVNLLSGMTGVALTYNPAVLFSAGFLGIPGVCALLFSKLIMGF